MTLMGSQEETAERLMVRKPVSLNWMHNKYGDSTNPFEVIIMMDNNQGGVDGKWSDSADNNQFRYQYRR